MLTKPISVDSETDLDQIDTMEREAIASRATSKKTALTRRATLAELAKHTGLSKPTLSRALNDYPDIAETTKNRVREAAKLIGYEPSSRARQLSVGRAEAIGLITPMNSKGLRSAYQSEFMNSLAVSLAALGHDLLLHAVDEPEKEVEAYARLAKAGKVDGFVVMRTREIDPRINFLRENNIPFVTQGRFSAGADQAWLDIDAEQGFYEVTSHLIELGHKKISYLAGDPGMYSSRYRQSGIERAMKDAGLRLHSTYNGDFTAESGRLAVRSSVTKGLDFTALICANDAMAMGAISAASELGIHVPGDLSITGYDGVRLAEIFNPPITTISHSAADCGASVASMIVSLVRKEDSRDLQRLVKPTLILRGSTLPPKGLS
ncbi:MAG: LacI family DNA-binding transcriptional regulator [Alphaproteobacteria bacterium]